MAFDTDLSHLSEDGGYQSQVSVRQHAAHMVGYYRDLLATCGGMQSVNVDGQTVSYADLEKKLTHWERRHRQLEGKRPTVVRIDMSKF